MAYNGYYSGVLEREDAQAVLPQDGERLEFGVHRLDREDRECPMWPLKVPNGNARFRNWMKGATKGHPEVVALLARVKAGEVPNEVAATIVVRNSRPVTWVTQVEREAALERLRDDWYNNRITATEAEEGRRRLDAA